MGSEALPSRRSALTEPGSLSCRSSGSRSDAYSSAGTPGRLRRRSPSPGRPRRRGLWRSRRGRQHGAGQSHHPSPRTCRLRHALIFRRAAAAPQRRTHPAGWDERPLVACAPPPAEGLHPSRRRQGWVDGAEAHGGDQRRGGHGGDDGDEGPEGDAGPSELQEPPRRPTHREVLTRGGPRRDGLCPALHRRRRSIRPCRHLRTTAAPCGVIAGPPSQRRAEGPRRADHAGGSPSPLVGWRTGAVARVDLRPCPPRSTRGSMGG